MTKRKTIDIWSRTERKVALRRRLLAHLLRVEQDIAKLTPLKMLKKDLANGSISSAWFVQRLVDMGMSIQAALNELQTVINTTKGKTIEQVSKDDAIESEKKAVWLPPIRATKFPATPFLKSHLPAVKKS